MHGSYGIYKSISPMFFNLLDSGNTRDPPNKIGKPVISTRNDEQVSINLRIHQTGTFYLHLQQKVNEM